MSGPFKKKSPDGLIPACVFQRLRGKKITPQVIEEALGGADSVAEAPVKVSSVEKAPAAVEKKSAPVLPVQKTLSTSVAPSDAPSRARSKFSILGSLAGRNSSSPSPDKSEAPSAQLPAEPFQEADLLKYWEEYALRMKQEGHPGLFSAMMCSAPNVAPDGKKLLFRVSTGAMAREIEDGQVDLIIFLKQRLKNYDIALSVEVDPLIRSKHRPYSPREKYDHLNKINPELDRLRETLDLSIDF